MIPSCLQVAAEDAGDGQVAERAGQLTAVSPVLEQVSGFCEEGSGAGHVGLSERKPAGSIERLGAHVPLPRDALQQRLQALASLVDVAGRVPITDQRHGEPQSGRVSAGP